MAKQLTQQPLELDALTCRTDSSDVLSLAGREHDDLLLRCLPGDGTLAVEEHHPTRALHVVDVASPIGVAVADETSFFFFLACVDAPKGLGPSDVAEQVLDCALVFAGGRLHEFAEVVHREAYVGARVHQVA